MSQAPPDIRVSIFDPVFQTTLMLDASPYIGKGILKYTDTPDGCDACTIPLLLYYEDVAAQGVWTANNIIEISSGDNTLQTSIGATTSGGTVKLYLDTNWAFSGSWIDAQQVYLWDGVNLTMRCPVTAVGSDGGGQYVTVGTPLDGGGIPAYNASQTIVGRRRYCGRIARRERTNDKNPLATITCVGIKNDFSGQIGSYAYNTAANVDIGQAIFQAMNLFASSYPWMTINSGNFPTVGQIYTGVYHDTDPLSFASDVLKQISTADGWHVRIGHDRTPRMVKLYTASGNTYAYNITVNQTSPTQAFSVRVADQDLSNFYTQIKVIGDVDPLTKKPVSAIVNDTNSQTVVYGTVSHPFVVSGKPVQVQGLKTTAQCAAYGQSLLDANSLAKSAQQLVVYTRRNDIANIALPGGMKSGDVLSPTANIIATGFTGQKNLIPDSGILYGSGGDGVNYWNATTYWDLSHSGGVAIYFVVNREPTLGHGFLWFGNGSPFGVFYTKSGVIQLQAGTYTISGWIDATYATGGNAPAFNVFDPTLTTVYAIAAQSSGLSGRVSATFTLSSATQVVVLCNVNGTTVPNTQYVAFIQPQLERSVVATAYSQSSVSPTPPDINGLVTSVTTCIDGTTTDMYQQASFSSMLPPWNAAITEKASATATALVNNTLTRAGLDQYFVDQAAYPFTSSPSSLVVTVPSFPAVFAAGTTPVQCGGNTFTLTANTMTWVWLNSNNTWTQKNDTSSVSGAIPYAFFQTNSSGVVGSDNLASVGLLNIPMSYMLNNAVLVPTFSGASITQAVTGNLASQINVSFDVTNQPTDGSFSKIIFWYRQHGQPTWLVLGTDVPRDNSGNPQSSLGPFYSTGVYSAKFPDAANGIEYDFGFSLESGASAETAVISLGNITPSSNSTPGSGGITLPGGALPPYNTNLLSDSNFYNSPFNGSNIAASSSYWTFQLIDGTSFYIGKGQAADGSNYLAWTSGSSGSNRYGYSKPVPVVTGQTYVVSCYMDATHVPGPTLPQLLVYDFTSGSLGSNLVAQAQAAGQSGRIQSFWTATAGVTQVVVLLSNNSCTISSSILVAATPQFELSPTSPGYASTYHPTTGVNANGTQDHGAMSSQTQVRIGASSELNVGSSVGSVTSNLPHANNSTPVLLRVDTSAALHVANDVGSVTGNLPYSNHATAVTNRIGSSSQLVVDTSVGSVSGYLPQSNHDPAVLLGSTGYQNNLVPDSGILFGSGGDGVTYWSTPVYWDFTSAGAAFIAFNANSLGSNGFVWTGTNAANSSFIVSHQIRLAAGTYTLSGVIDATNVSSGSVFWGVYSPGLTAYGQVFQTAGHNSRVSGSFTIPSAGYYIIVASMNGATASSSGGTAFAQPQLEVGSLATAYVPTSVPAQNGNWAHGAMSTPVQNRIGSGGSLDVSGGPGSVLNNLPYANHASGIQAGVDSSGNLIGVRCVYSIGSPTSWSTTISSATSLPQSYSNVFSDTLPGSSSMRFIVEIEGTLTSSGGYTYTSGSHNSVTAGLTGSGINPWSSILDLDEVPSGFVGTIFCKAVFTVSGGSSYSLGLNVGSSNGTMKIAAGTLQFTPLKVYYVRNS